MNALTAMPDRASPVLGAALRGLSAIDGISVVICTYNRQWLVEKLVNSLVVQLPSIVPVQVILVDNNSSDDTAAYGKSLAADRADFTYILETNQGLSYARNSGGRAARFEYLIYLDDDATVPPHFLAALADVLNDNRPDLFGGPIYPDYADPRPAWFPEDMEVRKKASVSGFHNEITLSGGNFGIRRSVLERVGGFDIRFGMKGSKLNLLEDRLMVEAYRRLTPAGEQKLYYSLETYIHHYTPARRMEARFQMKRAYYGKAQFIEHELDSGIRHPGLVLRTAMRAWPSHFFELASRWFGRNKSDKARETFIRTQVAFAFRTGELIGSLRFFFSGRRRKARQAREQAEVENRPLQVIYLTVEDPAGPWEKSSTTLRELRVLERRLPDLISVKPVQVQPISRFIRTTLHESNLRAADVLLFSDYKYMRTVHSSRTAHPHLQYIFRLQSPKSLSYRSYAKKSGDFSWKRQWQILYREFIAVRHVDETVIRSNEKAPARYGRIVAPRSRRSSAPVILMVPPGQPLTPEQKKKEDLLVKSWTPILKRARRWAPRRNGPVVPTE